MYYSERFIISGSIFEYYKYDRPICTTRIGSPGGRKKGQNNVKYREDVLQKAKKEVRRLINANLNQWTNEEEERVPSKFLTLTFKDNVTDIKWANREFSKFIMRLNDNLGYKIKYLTVIEFQKRGAIHYHTVIFNMPYKSVKELQAIWKHGFVKINRIDNVTNVGAYVCKYMTKADDERLIGQKMYFKSTGLLQPQVVMDYDEVVSWKEHFQQNVPTFKTEFEAPFIGKIEYAQFNYEKVVKENNGKKVCK